MTTEYQITGKGKPFEIVKSRKEAHIIWEQWKEEGREPSIYRHTKSSRNDSFLTVQIR